MKKLLSVFGTLALLFSLFSCSKDEEEKTIEDNPYKMLELSTKSSDFIKSGSSFSFEFIDRINAVSEKDYIVSPLSMQFLLGMLLNGADDKTADEICAVLGYGEGETAAVNEFCLTMLEQLPQLDKQTRMNIANAIFVNERYSLLDAFKNATGDYYQAEVSNLDFSKEKKALEAINGWCSKQTKGMVPKILEEIDPEVAVYLLNALYFKSQWTEPFKKSATTEEVFTRESGKTSKVKMMKKTESLRYVENDCYQTVIIPYGNKVFSMYVFLPKAGHTIAEITERLRNEELEQALRNQVICKVDLWLPRFETEFGMDVTGILSAMGLPNVYTAMAEGPVNLDFIVQKAAIKVNEEGTEAAAVSMAGAKGGVLLQGSADFHANHPFLYLIIENTTRAILFAGRYGGE